MEKNLFSSHLFLSIIILLNISFVSSWDYKEHGRDWTDRECQRGQQAPGKITTDAEKLDTSNFFYANFGLMKGTKIKANLESIEDNNILSLNFGEGKFGSIIYNLYDPWQEKGPLGYDEYELMETTCSNIFIKIPGEHLYEGEGSEAELQINCTFIKEHSTEKRGAFVVIPIKIDDTNECEFSKAIKKVFVENDYKFKDLPKEIEFDKIDIIDSYAMMDGTTYYESKINYPPCTIKSVYFYVNRKISFSQTVIDQLKNCFDEKNKEGNNRDSFDISESYLYPQ